MKNFKHTIDCYIFISLFFVFGCKKSDDTAPTTTTPTPTPTTQTSSAYFIRFTIDNIPLAFKDTLTYYTESGADFIIIPVTSDYSPYSYITDSAANGHHGGAGFFFSCVNYSSSIFPSKRDSIFQTMFPLGNMQFQSVLDCTPTLFINFRFTDVSGTIFYSDDQILSSNFTITSSTALNASERVVEGTFNCSVVNGVSLAHLVTNGVFRLKFKSN